LTISAYLSENKNGEWTVTSYYERDLLGELDVVEHDEGTLDIEDSSVVDAGGDVVVRHGGFNLCD